MNNGSWSDLLKSTAKSIRDETISWVIPGFLLAGLGLLTTLPGFDDPTWSLLSAAVLFFAGAIAWGLKQRRYLLAAWLLIAASMLVIYSTAAWKGIGATIGLAALPVGLTMLMISRKAGLLAAAASSLLLFLVPLPTPDAATLRAVSFIALWSTAGMVWLVYQPLLTSFRWAWYGYEQSQSLLQQSREYQARLAQAMSELTEANNHLTRLNQLANSLRKSAEDERNVKTRFVANVSHELRTPLNMIIGFSEMMMQSPYTYGHDLPPALLADLAVVLRNSQHLSSLIDDVLDLSQIEAGQMALTKEWVNVEEMIDSALVAVRPLYRSKNLYLKTDLQKGIPPVYCDRTRIREVLLNLLSNAGRFTERGGVSVTTGIEGDHLVVSVQDTGKGIEPELQGRIFQPFQQLEDITYRHYGGSGLGLSISKHFVEMHAGKMWLASEPGVESTFFFRLPVRPPVDLEPGISRWFNPHQTYEERPARSRSAPVPLRPRIAVVESGGLLQRLLDRYMDDTEICGFPTLEQALEAIAQEPVHALVVNREDVNEALLRVNQDGQPPYGVPVILSSIPGTETAASSLGVSEYLMKPISREKLLAAIRKACPGAGTVLVVDDEPDARQLFARMLTSEENAYRVLRAADGREALEILREEKPDVILLDLVMPETDGFQFLRLKSQRPELSEIPVISISARDPIGQPILAKTLSVTCQPGLSMHEILDCIRALTAILSKTGPTAGLALTTGPAG